MSAEGLVVELEKATGLKCEESVYESEVWVDCKTERLPTGRLLQVIYCDGYTSIEVAVSHGDDKPVFIEIQAPFTVLHNTRPRSIVELITRITEFTKQLNKGVEQ